jgi:SAM-dependent methyltransferase
MSSPTAPPPLAPRARLRWSLVRRTVAELAPKTILELGCGLGGVGVRLAAMAQYTAVEPDDQSWAAAHERITPHGGVVVHGDHNKVPAGSYDLVCAFEVLEHIADDAAALAEWMPLVRPGGHLLLSVPADPERFGPFDVRVGHYRRYTAEQLRERLAAAGGVDIDVRHYGWPLGVLLEAVRNRLSRDSVSEDGGSAQERTSTSGRVFQPTKALTGAIIGVGVAPFLVLQRMRPGTGTGLVAVARRPT